MSREVEETPSKSNDQPIQSNPYAHNNPSYEQYPPTVEPVSNEKPPPYTGYVQPSIEPQRQDVNLSQSKSLVFTQIEFPFSSLGRHFSK